MTYLLEYFTKSVGEEAETTFVQPRLTCWKVLKGSPDRGLPGVAGLMADSLRCWVSRAEAEAAVEGQTRLASTDAARFVERMVADGLLAEDMRYLDGEYREVLTFPYQRFGDHLVARHLLGTSLNTASPAALRRSFYADRPIGAVFALDRWRSNYAEPGLASALMLEFPERVKKLGGSKELVHYLPKSRRLVAPFASVFLDGLYWRSHSAFSNETASIVESLLAIGDPGLSADTYEVLTGLAIRPNHPYSADRLAAHLSSMQMSERDLVWSEYLRGASPHSNLRRLLAWVERTERPHVDASVAANEIRLLALCLTTTDRELRDRCTRALVLVGERQPRALFEAAIDSLGFDDPYVPERVLAAAYGIALRRWGAHEPHSDFLKALTELTEQLISHVLSPSAPYQTWHALTRGYAIGIVQLCKLLQPRAIRRDLRDLLTPRPEHAPSPFRSARGIRASDIDGAEQAIHMDFGNYTIGRLVEGRRNYDMDNREYRIVRRQIIDRMRRLGYSAEEFGDIDAQIGRHSWHQEGSTKVDRYGKKYSWIAYFEMHGLREAAGLLSEWREGERTSDCDIDPSFPDAVAVWQPPLRDPFGKAPVDRLEWLRDGPVPEFSTALDRAEVDGIPGGWVLLDASWRQRGPDGREITTHVAAMLASSASSRRLKAEFEAGRRPGDQGVPETGNDYYTYHGEVPWSIRYGADVRTPTGKPRRNPDRAFTYFDGNRWRAGVPVELPSRRWAWEDYHSVLNQVGPVTLPAPAISERLRLRLVGGSSDMLDDSGNVASLFRVSPTGAFDGQFFYMRHDLLERYLADRGLRLVRSVWGERTFHYKLFERNLPHDLQRQFEARSNEFGFVIGLEDM